MDSTAPLYGYASMLLRGAVKYSWVFHWVPRLPVRRGNGRNHAMVSGHREETAKEIAWKWPWFQATHAPLSGDMGAFPQSRCWFRWRRQKLNSAPPELLLCFLREPCSDSHLFCQSRHSEESPKQRAILIPRGCPSAESPHCERAQSVGFQV